MIDRKFSSNLVCATILWVAGLSLVVVAMFTRAETGELGLMCSGAAMVFNIRGFFCGLLHREQDAFDLGRESVRSIR